MLLTDQLMMSTKSAKQNYNTVITVELKDWRKNWKQICDM